MKKINVLTWISLIVSFVTGLFFSGVVPNYLINSNYLLPLFLVLRDYSIFLIPLNFIFILVILIVSLKKKQSKSIVIVAFILSLVVLLLYLCALYVSTWGFGGLFLYN